MKRTSLVSTVGIILIAVILVLANLIANTQFFRLDLTEGKIFSLSKASKGVVANLDEPLTIKVFASSNLSPQMKDIKRFLNDLLSGYSAYSKGHLRYEFADPGSDEQLEKDAQTYRIPPFQENVWNKDQLELKKVYMGLVVLYGDKQETIPVVRSTMGLEYNITSLIKRITSQQSLKVGFLTGHGEASPFEDMKQANSVLEGNYQVTTIDLAAEKSIPDDIDALIIAGINEEIKDADKILIDQYLMSGRGVGWFYGQVSADLQQATAQDKRLMIDSWTQNYGFKVNTDAIADAKCGMVNIQQNVGFFKMNNTIDYPYFPTILDFNKQLDISKNLEIISMFFPSSIDTNLAGPVGVKITPFMYTSEKSLIEKGRYNILATRKWTPAEFTNSRVPVAAAIEGSFKSYFTNREVPLDEDTQEPVVDDGSLKTQSPDNTRMVVVGDGKLFKDDYLSNPANIYLLMNIVDWLVGDTDLIALRTREVKMRPLKDISDNQKQVWKYVNWFLPPALIILMGLVYWQVRKSGRNREIL